MQDQPNDANAPAKGRLEPRQLIVPPPQSSSDLLSPPSLCVLWYWFIQPFAALLSPLNLLPSDPSRSLQSPLDAFSDAISFSAPARLLALFAFPAILTFLLDLFSCCSACPIAVSLSSLNPFHGICGSLNASRLRLPLAAPVATLISRPPTRLSLCPISYRPLLPPLLIAATFFSLILPCFQPTPTSS